MKPVVNLTNKEREDIVVLSRSTNAIVARKARIILLFDEGFNGVEIASKVNITMSCAYKVRLRFLERGLSEVACRKGCYRTDVTDADLYDSTREELKAKCKVVKLNRTPEQWAAVIKQGRENAARCRNINDDMSWWWGNGQDSTNDGYDR